MISITKQARKVAKSSLYKAMSYFLNAIASLGIIKRKLRTKNHYIHRNKSKQDIIMFDINTVQAKGVGM